MSSKLKYLRETELLRALKFFLDGNHDKKVLWQEEIFFKSSAAIINKKISFSVDVMIKVLNTRQLRAFSKLCAKTENVFVPKFENFILKT